MSWCRGRDPLVLGAPVPLVSEHGGAVECSSSTAVSPSCCSWRSSGLAGIYRNPLCLFFIFQKNNKKTVFAGPRRASWGGSRGQSLVPLSAGQLNASALSARGHPVATGGITASCLRGAVEKAGFVQDEVFLHYFL